MKISEVYSKYRIMPNLAEHMMRVASVAAMICDGLDDINKVDVISAALLHDMGNIIKFKLDLFPQFLEPEGLDYWLNVQEEFKTKYSNDEHEATIKIAEELEVSDRILELVKAVGFSKAVENSKHNDIEKKICCYSDHRVTPFGITSLENRMQEGRKRFQLNKNITEDVAVFENLANHMKLIEKQIFEHCRIKPEDITDESIQKKFESIRDFELNFF